MKKLCPDCQTINDAVGFDLSTKELHNLHQLNLSEHLCKTCYNKELTNLATITKAELIPLNKEKEITQAAYYEAYNAWKAKADLFKAIDYNMSLIKFNDQKKIAAVTKKAIKTDDPISIELLAKQLLANLSLEQQESIMRKFSALSNLNQQSL